MTIGSIPICDECKHYHATDNNDFKCDAYPEGIPIEIITNEIDHHKPYKGDQGIKFESKRKRKESGKTSTEIVFEAKALKRKDGIIYCPTIPLTEGVFDGLGFPVLRLYEEFSKDAHWLNGLTVLTNHEDLNPNARRIGQLSDSQARPEKKDVAAITQFYEIDLTQREIEAITSRQPIHGSLALSYNLEEASGTWNGKPYVAIERGPYVFYEYSMVRQGVVTPDDGAGFNLECKACASRKNSHSQSLAPGGADMEEARVQEMIEEAVKPLKEQNAVLEQKNIALESEIKLLKEGIITDKNARVFEAFQAKLKPGHQEKAKEHFEASQKDPLWITENADKFIQPRQERKLGGNPLGEGGDVPGVTRPFTTEEMNAKQSEIARKVK